MSKTKKKSSDSHKVRIVVSSGKQAGGGGVGVRDNGLISNMAILCSSQTPKN